MTWDVRPGLARGPHVTARSLALAVLLECHQQRRFIQETLDEALAASRLQPADRALTTQLAYGVLRRRGTLDAVLKSFVHRPRHEVEPWIWETLRLGTYQLLLLDHIPPHAAVHATVELAMAMNRPRAKGFLNGVLRSVAALVTADMAAEPSVVALPLDGGRYRRLARPVLPDPIAAPLEYIVEAFALPAWLVDRWSERYDLAELYRLGFWSIQPPPLWLRCNVLRTTRAQYLDLLASRGISAEAGSEPSSIRILEHVSIRTLPGYDEGLFTVQDEAAMHVAAALNPRPGMRVLDLCAAPGGKTTHLAELMGDDGEIIACDVEEHRLRTLRGLAGRLGLSCITPRQLPVDGEPPPGPYDAILVDVPCSNTGVLARRPEVRWRLKPMDLDHLVPLQTRLLILALERIRPGGAVVYSTCSIEPAENQQVVSNVLLAFPDTKLEAEESLIPGQPADGGYWARLRRGG